MQAVDDNLCLSSLHDEYNILCSVSTPLCDADILFKIRLLVDLRHQCQASPRLAMRMNYLQYERKDERHKVSFIKSSIRHCVYSVEGHIYLIDTNQTVLLIETKVPLNHSSEHHWRSLADRGRHNVL